MINPAKTETNPNVIQDEGEQSKTKTKTSKTKEGK